jgi:MYXO-CTERM domain-containing protein
MAHPRADAPVAAHASGAAMAVALLVAATVAVAPSASAHGEHQGWTHTQPLREVLGPGESKTVEMSFDGTPLHAGWWLVFFGSIGGSGTLRAELMLATTIATWNWPAGTTLMHAPERGLEAPRVQLPSEGFYQFKLSNPSSQPVDFQLAYDQTCDCTAKRMALDAGSLWINLDAERNQRGTLSLRIVPFETVFGQAKDPIGTIAVTAHPSADPAAGFSTPNSMSYTPSRDSRLGTLDVPFRAEQEGQQYFLVTIEREGGAGWELQVRPDWEFHAGNDAPLPMGLALLALVGLALLRRRS